MVTPTDPLYRTQWHFLLIGDIETIWADYDGSGVTVGVYDTGIESAHEDLAANYNASLELVDEFGNTVSQEPAGTEGHGTAVAGIIGAANNGIGGVGVAWGVSLTGVNLYDGAVDWLHMIGQGAAFDIVSNSWGGMPLYQDYQSLTSGGFDDLAVQSYAMIAAVGRGGLGTLVVKSAGNDNLDCNGEGLDASRFTITVAATERDGMASHYSSFGRSVLLTAPAAAVTTDMSGDQRHPLDKILVNSYAAPSFGDIDGDGDVDVVVGASDGTLRTFINVAGVFTEATGAANPFDGVSVPVYSSPSFVDLDGDGDDDLVVGSVRGELQTFRNDGAGVFTELTGADNPLDGLAVRSYSTPSFADIDGDGDMDMVVGTFNGTLTTFFNTAGVFVEATGAANPFDGVDVGTSSAPSFVDLDGDGDMDAVVGASDGTLRSFQNDGAGGFTELIGASNPFDGVRIDRYSRPSFADLDGDGDMDAVVGEWNGTLFALLNDGEGSFTPVIRYGYDPTAYTDRFSGTSSSAPVVSGVIALMLQANSDLGWRDVQNILAASARLTGSAFDATIKASVEDGLWEANSAGTWNGGGYHIHTNYGYGMVDAFNAVRMAEVWSLFGPAQQSGNEMTASGSVNMAGVPATSTALGGYTTTIEILDNVLVEHVALTIDFTGFIWDLLITLTSADGTVLVVSDQAGLPDSQVDWPWTFGIDHLRGELSAGIWTLNITDLDPDRIDSEILHSASLDIYGSAYTADTVHHITDEFFLMAGFDSTRTVIVDWDGGIDWINMAAVTGHIDLKLFNTGGWFGINGVAGGLLQGVFEHMVGGDNKDWIIGNRLANEFHGARGNDTLHGNAGADRLFGGRGHDALFGGADDDLLDGGDGDDVLRGGGGDDLLDGGDGIDTAVFTGQINTTVDLRTSGPQDTGHGFDTLISIENVSTASGDDVLTGNAAANILTAGAGNDTLRGEAGDDELRGGQGDDVLDGGDGDDVLRGGLGNDTAVFSGAINTTVDLRVSGPQDTGHGIDTLIGIENITSSSGDDLLIGNRAANILTAGEGNDTLIGGAGDDTLSGGAGDDEIRGGAGIDTAVFSGAVNTTVNLRKKGPQDTGHGIDTLINIENVTTAEGDDLLIGNEAANILNAGSGNDVLHGGGGDDTLIGGMGRDTLTGGAGADVFVFDTSPDALNVDVITDFTVALDTIWLDSAVFDALIWGGLAASAFVSISGGQIAGADHRIIYAFDLGDLFYDNDGAGGADAVKFAQLGTGLALTNADFFVF